MKLLILGARGQLGRCLQDRLRGAIGIAWEAHGIDTLDITDANTVRAALDRFGPDVVINAAAYTAVDVAEDDRDGAFAVNAVAPQTLADACTARDAALLHVSTDYVFDGNATRPYVETDRPAPLGVYGESKLAGEQAVLAAGPRHVVVRTAWVFSEYGSNFVKTMLALAKRESLRIVADQRGSPTYAGDLANALLTIVRAGRGRPGGLYHFGGEPAVTWFDFASAIFEQAKESGVIAAAPTLHAITTADYPTRAARPAWSVLSNDLVTSRFGALSANWRQALADIAPLA